MSESTYEAKERLRKALEPLCEQDPLRIYQADELFLAINALILSRITDERRRDDEE